MAILLKYPRLFLMFYLQMVLTFGNAFKLLTVFMFVYKLLEERIVDSSCVCVVLTTIWVMYISLTQIISWYYQEIKTSRKQMPKLPNDFQDEVPKKKVGLSTLNSSEFCSLLPCAIILQSSCQIMRNRPKMKSFKRLYGSQCSSIRDLIVVSIHY